MLPGMLAGCHGSYMVTPSTTQTDTAQCRILLFTLGVCIFENMAFLHYFAPQFPIKGIHKIFFSFGHSL